MKKIMSLVLALALVLSMGVTVFADENSTTIENETGSGNKDIDVTAKYEAGNKAWGGEKYYVTISWTEVNSLKYKDNTVTYKWNTTDMQYEESQGTDGAFVSDGKDVITVKVENKSNMAITATCSVNKETGYEMSVAYGATNSPSFDVGTNAPQKYTDLNSVTSVKEETSVTISNVRGTALTQDTKVATLTVTIAKSANATTPTAD